MYVSRAKLHKFSTNFYKWDPPHLLETKEEREHKSNYNSLHIVAIVLGCIAVAMCLISIVAISFCEGIIVD